MKELTLISLITVLLAACGSETPQPTEQGVVDAPAGEIEQTTVTATADGTPASIPAGTYALDKNHTYINFTYLHLGYSYPLLRVTGIDGELNLNGDDMAKSTVAIAIDASTIDSGLSRFDDELRSRGYFDVDRNPYITFTTHSYEPESETSGKLTGFLTVRGKTNPLTLDVQINNAMIHPMTNKPVIGFSAVGTLKRSDFGLERNIPFVADKVTVEIEAEFAEGSSETSAGAVKIAMDTTAAAPAESLVVVPVVSTAPTDSLIPGKYTITASGRRGDTTSTLTINADGSGAIEGQRGASEFSGTSFTEHSFSFMVSMATPTGEMEMEYEGVVDGDVITGNIQTTREIQAFTGERL